MIADDLEWVWRSLLLSETYSYRCCTYHSLCVCDSVCLCWAYTRDLCKNVWTRSRCGLVRAWAVLVYPLWGERGTVEAGVSEGGRSLGKFCRLYMYVQICIFWYETNIRAYNHKIFIPGVHLHLPKFHLGVREGPNLWLVTFPVPPPFRTAPCGPMEHYGPIPVRRKCYFWGGQVTASCNELRLLSFVHRGRYELFACLARGVECLRCRERVKRRVK